MLIALHMLCQIYCISNYFNDLPLRIVKLQYILRCIDKNTLLLNTDCKKFPGNIFILCEVVFWLQLLQAGYIESRGFINQSESIYYQ